MSFRLASSIWSFFFKIQDWAKIQSENIKTVKFVSDQC